MNISEAIQKIGAEMTETFTRLAEMGIIVGGIANVWDQESGQMYLATITHVSEEKVWRWEFKGIEASISVDGEPTTIYLRAPNHPNAIGDRFYISSGFNSYEPNLDKALLKDWVLPHVAKSIYGSLKS